MKDARFWVKEGERVRCYLCPHHCSISDMRRGICGVRENRDGKLYAMSYGKISSANLDPIEKKPLFHFRPGRSRILSRKHRMQYEVPPLSEFYYLASFVI